MPLHRQSVLDLLRREQDGVVSRAQLVELGAEKHELERLLRRRELVRVVPGVYVDHTGPLTPAQRTWVAVLACWPAALARQSALPWETSAVVHLAVAPNRSRVVAPDGVRVHRTQDLDARVAWQRRPPRVRVEHAAIDVASGHVADDRVAAAFNTLARAVHSRLTTPARVRATLRERHRVPGRRVLDDLLDDVATGAGSVLEQGYLHRVERAHALPIGERQVRRRADGRTTYTDVEYAEYHRIVELDGRAFHDGRTARDADAGRDLANLVHAGDVTARLTWGMVFDTGCRTAELVGRWLRDGGWTGRPVRCQACRRAA